VPATCEGPAAEAYLGGLIRELELKAAMFDTDRTVTSLAVSCRALPGLNRDQLGRLLASCAESFSCEPDCGNPCTLEFALSHPLARRLGESREQGVTGLRWLLPCGAMNRDDDELESLRERLEEARHAGMACRGVELARSPDLASEQGRSAVATLLQIARPDEIRGVFWPALLTGDMAASSACSDLFAMLSELGYRPAGTDCFVRLAPDREARRDRIGLGLNAVSCLGSFLARNTNCLDSYLRCLQKGETPPQSVLWMNDRQLLDGELAAELAQGGQLEFRSLGLRCGIDFEDHCRRRRTALAVLETDGLLVRDDVGLTLTDAGRAVWPAVAQAFGAAGCDGVTCGQ
jgi:oxygen-independent coproporphyrinogen-3 oxidase